MIEKEYYLWLSSITTLELPDKHQLMKKFENPYNIYMASSDRLRKAGIKDRVVEKIIESKRSFSIVEAERRMYRNNISYIYRNDLEYPDKLKNICNPPIGLFCIGRLPDTNKPSVGIVGSRQYSEYGKTMTFKFGRELAEAGCQIISGLALGIDGYSHEAAISVGGYTCGILGNGIDDIYPRQNYNLFLEMYEKGGVVSEYYIGTPGLKTHFPERNRIISALSDCIVVIEAKKKSGTMITVDRALEQGKDVFVVPGRIGDENSEGCLEMAKQGADILLDTDEILENMSEKYPNWACFQREEDNQYALKIPKLSDFSKKSQRYDEILLEKDELLVYASLSFVPLHTDEIIINTNLDYFTVISVLDELKRKKMIIESSPEYYVKK
jgi:DNA processing protein